jgi:RimJ/RimL family protein N-acetyltransferase
VPDSATPPEGTPESAPSEAGRLPNTERVVLRDGSVVHIRPISGGDVAELEAAVERLTPESRYRRFFSALKKLDAKTLTYFTNVDHVSHEALVALEPAHGELVGVARYVSAEKGSESAEVAMVVADEWHGRGLATVLLAELTTRAREAGVLRFQASCLAMNHDAIDVLKSLGPTSLKSSGSGLTDLTIELSPGSAETALQTALGHAARGDLEHPLKLET